MLAARADAPVMIRRIPENCAFISLTARFGGELTSIQGRAAPTCIYETLDPALGRR
jgi:hypothetical protein